MEPIASRLPEHSTKLDSGYMKHNSVPYQISKLELEDWSFDHISPSVAKTLRHALSCLLLNKPRPLRGRTRVAIHRACALNIHCSVQNLHFQEYSISYHQPLSATLIKYRIYTLSHGQENSISYFLKHPPLFATLRMDLAYGHTEMSLEVNL